MSARQGNKELSGNLAVESYVNSRNLLFFCIGDENTSFDYNSNELNWNVEKVSSLKDLSYQLKHYTYNVCLVYLNKSTSQKVLELEDICAIHPGVCWIALVEDINSESASVKRLISEYFSDYFHYPVKNLALLDFGIEHANGMSYLKKRNSAQQPATNYEMVGSSDAMLKLFKAIRRVAGVDAPLLITGESGTGKEMIAQAIHERSERADGPFVAVNCGALPENLIQSELFGYEKGAFTGAHQRKIGKIEAASGGTLFLDEIGDLPLVQQVNLLRFLQEKTIERIGSTESIHVDVRVVAATHVDLNKAIQEGQFREDLYYRLNVLSLQVPPLRERGDDAVLLAQYFFNLFKSEAHHNVGGFTRRALVSIAQHRWPGNVRELINRVRRAIVMCEGRKITHEDLRLTGSDMSFFLPTLDEARVNAERETIIHALNASRRNVSEAARILGVSRITLYRLMRKHGLEQEVDSDQE